MKFFKDEEAVSPVIGVILMVAITVILAAVIAAFVFGLGTGVQKTKSVGLTASQVGSNVTVTIQGGPDFNTLHSLSVTVDDDPGCATLDDTATSWGVGATLTCPDIPNPGIANKVIVVGTFLDESKQVLLDTSV